MTITPNAAGPARDDAGDAQPLTVEELEEVSGGVDLEGCDVSCLPNVKCSGTD